MSQSRRLLTALLLLAAITLPSTLHAQRDYARGFHGANADVLQRGRQVLTLCNGVFVSERTVEQINAAELRAYPVPSSLINVDHELGTVAVEPGSNQLGATMRAAFREGIGCVVMGPEQTLEDLDALPHLSMPPATGDPKTIPWPEGDLVCGVSSDCFVTSVPDPSVCHSADPRR
jgi:hypothetical protein